MEEGDSLYLALRCHHQNKYSALRIKKDNDVSRVNVSLTVLGKATKTEASS